MNRALPFALGAALLIALDVGIIATARAVDPFAPVIFLSNLAAVFIGGIQLLYGVPLVLWLRRRRPGVAVGVGTAMALVLAVNAVALYR